MSVWQREHIKKHWLQRCLIEMPTLLLRDWVDSAKGWEHCVYLVVVLVPMISASQASESGCCWLTNPLCTPHSCSSAPWQLLTSVQKQSRWWPTILPERLHTSWLDLFIPFGHFITVVGTVSSFIFPFMDYYALIFRSAYNSCAMESARVDYDGLDECILWQMLDMRRGYTIWKSIQVSCGRKMCLNDN